MGRSCVGLLWLVLLAWLLPGCVTDSPAVSLVSAGDEVPGFTVTLSDGTVFTSDNPGPGGAVIVFFNTDCADCRAFLPKMQSFHDSDTSGRRVVCIAREESAVDIAEYWQNNGLTMPWSAQSDRRIYNLFATGGIPRVYEVTENGVIAAQYNFF